MLNLKKPANYLIMLSLLSGLFPFAFGQTVSPTQQSPVGTLAPASNVQVINNADGTQTTLQTIYCPQPSELVKTGLFWGTPTGGWKGYSESFQSSITGFIGAQWVGVNVGKMICIYRGNVAVAFPVNLQNDTLSQAPTGNLWGKDQGGYRNCYSPNPADCAFVVRAQSVNIDQIYKSLDFYKKLPNTNQQ